MLKDAVLFVTGAGKGIGEAFVKEILKKQAEFPRLRLFLTSRTASDLVLLKGLCVDAGVLCEILASDLSQEPLAALQACLRSFGRIDACIHIAGVGRFGNFLEMTADDLQFVMKTNVEASFLLMQAVYAQMKKQGSAGSLSGQIQWVTSVAADVPFEHSSIYCMSKYAQQGLIEVMRQYARKDRIRILEVKPGATFTPMWGEVTKDMQSKMMLPEDIAVPMIDALLLDSRTSMESITLRPIAGDL